MIGAQHNPYFELLELATHLLPHGTTIKNPSVSLLS